MLAERNSSRIASIQMQSILDEAIHMFLKDWVWQEANEQVKVGGTTWIEICTLFDSGGYRSKVYRLDCDDKAKRRAEERNPTRARKGRSCSKRKSLRQELKWFCRAVGYIVVNEVAGDKDPKCLQPSGLLGITQA